MWELFVSFFKIGLFTFGGGYAMLPVIQREIIEKRKWCSEEEVLDYYAVAQCTPGVIAVNTATFVGYKCRKITGGVVATGAVILPSLLIIMVIAACIRSFADYPVVQHALAGIRVAVAVLVLRTVFQMFRKNVRTAAAAGIFFVALVLSLVLRVPSMYIVVGAIVYGVLFGARGREKA